jgi:hypothetical protein
MPPEASRVAVTLDRQAVSGVVDLARRRRHPGGGDGATGDLDGDGALEVRAPDPGPDGLERGDRRGMGVAVGVVRACRDQPHLGPDVRQERRIGRPGAVVGDGEQPGAERIRLPDRDPGLRGDEEVGLCLPLDVAGDERDLVAPGRPEDQRPLVELAGGVAVRPAGWRPEDLEFQVADARRGRCREHPDRYVQGRGARVGDLDRGDRGRRRGTPDRPDLGHIEDVGHAADVVEVAVGDGDDVQLGAAVAREPPRRAIVLPRVHEDGGGRGP